MKREVNVITHGGIDIKHMSESEREAFMAALLDRVLGLRRKHRKEEGHAT